MYQLFPNFFYVGRGVSLIFFTKGCFIQSLLICTDSSKQASSKTVVTRIKYIHCKCNGSSFSKSRLCLHVLPKFITFAVVLKLKGLWKSKDIPPFCFKRNNFKGYNWIFTIHFHIDLNDFHSVAFCAKFSGSLFTISGQDFL